MPPQSEKLMELVVPLIQHKENETIHKDLYWWDRGMVKRVKVSAFVVLRSGVQKSDCFVTLRSEVLRSGMTMLQASQHALVVLWSHNVIGLKTVIESGLPDKDAKVTCLKYFELNKCLEEIDHARALYKHSSQFTDPRSDPDFWNKWHELEVQHGDKDIFREMLHVKRSVSSSYIQVLQNSSSKDLVCGIANIGY
ncbi:hypothetical protein H5410_043355 [Solanum commersonii]|uniref:Pre-mRNA-splicing factor Syf1/CRNKL1-like C-terminal HAT-repeats domain-containing protein n=1 Tax=Solanum commersonii TaxID=4109 RepID=A0A9J5XXB7_SOLCO|nr:hypothetical protein H5410_043355 [Solanum commersonii]